MACCAANKIMIGLWMILCSVILSGMGVLFSFNRVIVAAGNMLPLPGLILIFGFKRMLRFFSQSFKGSISLALGFLCVVIGMPRTGIALEFCGVVVLICVFCRTQAMSLWRLPVAGLTFDESSRLRRIDESCQLQPSDEPSSLRQVNFCLGFCFYLVILFILAILAIIIEVKLQAT